MFRPPLSRRAVHPTALHCYLRECVLGHDGRAAAAGRRVPHLSWPGTVYDVHGVPLAAGHHARLRKEERVPARVLVVRAVSLEPLMIEGTLCASCLAMRHSDVTRKPLIGWAENCCAGLTLCATEQGDVQYRLCGGGLGCLKAHAGILGLPARDQLSGSCERDDAQIRMCTVVLVLLNRLRRP